jgi:hypothetical protein
MIFHVCGGEIREDSKLAKKSGLHGKVPVLVQVKSVLPID